MNILLSSEEVYVRLQWETGYFCSAAGATLCMSHTERGWGGGRGERRDKRAKLKCFLIFGGKQVLRTDRHHKNKNTSVWFGLTHHPFALIVCHLSSSCPFLSASVHISDIISPHQSPSPSATIKQRGPQQIADIPWCLNNTKRVIAVPNVICRRPQIRATTHTQNIPLYLHPLNRFHRAAEVNQLKWSPNHSEANEMIQLDTG